MENHEAMIKDFKKRFFISIGATVPIVLFSSTIQSIFGFELSFPGVQYITAGIATFVFIYGGFPFLKGFYHEIRSKKPGMMTLIGFAITVAYSYSTAVVFGLKGKIFYWELATLIDIMLAGHWIEMRSVQSASNALEKLARLMPDTAHKKVDGNIKDVSLSEIKKNDLLVIKPGEKIPADGTIQKGSSSIDESMLTGESKPVSKGEGDELIGGSINGTGSIELEVQKTGEESYLSKVIELVKKAQNSKSKAENISDKAALWLTIVAITTGIATLTGWLIAGKDFQFSLARMATVMVITCPHALGLAIPLVISVSTTKSAQNGFLIRNRTPFENARKISAIVFDKTGTLTEGKFGVSKIDPSSENSTEEELLSLAASVEQNSEHPIGAGITAEAQKREIDYDSAQNVQTIKGKGIEGTVNGETVEIVSPGYLREKGVEEHKTNDAPGKTEVYVLKNGNLLGSIILEDKIRDDSLDAITELKKMGITTYMLTGDNKDTAEYVAKELGLDGFFAEVLPDEKEKKINDLQEKHGFIAMTGDGINDAPALARADLGIAVGSGTDVAASTADIILVNSNPSDITSLIRFGKATYKKIIQNIIWATGYNLIAIPLASGIFAGLGIVLSPAFGAALMSVSTIIVAINAKLLKIPR